MNRLANTPISEGEKEEERQQEGQNKGRQQTAFIAMMELLTGISSEKTGCLVNRPPTSRLRGCLTEIKNQKGVDIYICRSRKSTSVPEYIIF